MTGSSIGKIFKVSTWGESHGHSLGCVIEGVPSNIKIDKSYIQKFLDKKKARSIKIYYTKERKDKVKILSGVFNGYTTGTPVSLVIENEDVKSKDYDDIKNKFRPWSCRLYLSDEIRNKRLSGWRKSVSQRNSCESCSWCDCKKDSWK